MAAEEKNPPRDRKAGNAISVDQVTPAKAAAMPAQKEKDSVATDKPKGKSTPVPETIAPNDVPEALRRRYFTAASKWSGEPAYFTTAQAKEPAFRDQGRRLVTASESEEVVRDLVAIAQHRGWSRLHVSGSETFRRAAWMEASRRGLEVKGYRPSERDLQELDRTRRDASRNSIAPAVDAATKERPRATLGQGRATDRSGTSDRSDRNQRAAQTQLRVMEAVVRTALFDNPEAITRVMKVATSRMQAHVQEGRQIRPAMVRDVRERKVDASPEKVPGVKARAPAQRTRGR